MFLLGDSTPCCSRCAVGDASAPSTTFTIENKYLTYGIAAIGIIMLFRADRWWSRRIGT